MTIQFRLGRVNHHYIDLSMLDPLGMLRQKLTEAATVVFSESKRLLQKMTKAVSSTGLENSIFPPGSK